jgi:hypothetical protein
MAIFFCVCHKNVVPLQVENNNTVNSIQQLVQYEKNNRITNTAVLVLWTAAYYGSVCEDSGGDEAGALRICDGDV